MTIKGGTLKFEQFGPMATHDSNISMEAKFQKFLINCFKDGALPPPIVDLLKATISIRPRLYGSLKPINMVFH